MFIPHQWLTIKSKKIWPKERGSKVSRQGGNMFSRQPVAKGDFMEAIAFEGQIGYPKNIGFEPSISIPKQLCCNIIKYILFLKVKIFRDVDVEVLTNDSREKLINNPNKDFFKLWFPLDNNVVTKIVIEFVHNLSNKSRNVTNRRPPNPYLNQFLNTQSPKTIKLNGFLNNKAMSNVLLKQSLILKLKKVMGISDFR